MALSVHQSVQKSDLELHLLAAQGCRRGQDRNQVKRASELCHRLHQSRALQRPLSSFAPQARGVLDQPSLSVVMRQSLRLALSELRELAFKNLCDTGMKRASWFT